MTLNGNIIDCTTIVFGQNLGEYEGVEAIDNVIIHDHRSHEKSSSWVIR